ncbi:MAG: hypothetical protein ACRCWG_03295 [Sarcina sp.]
MAFIFSGFISFWLVLSFVISSVIIFVIGYKKINNKKFSESELEIYGEKIERNVKRYITWIGIIIIIAIPVIYISYIYKIDNGNLLEVISGSNIELSIALNLIIYYVFISWYASRFTNDKIRMFFSNLNYYLKKFPQIFVGVIIFPIICLVVAYIEMNYILIPFIYSVGTIKIFTLSLAFLGYLLLFYIIEKFILFIFKGSDKFNIKLMVKTISIIALASLLGLYVYGNTPKLSSSHVSIALTTTLTLYGFLGVFKNHLKELWQEFKKKLGLDYKKRKNLSDKNKLDIKIQALDKELFELKKELEHLSNIDK